MPYESNTVTVEQHTVLYVEDQPVNALLMSGLFEQIPECRLVVAGCGREALDVARGLHPALLLLDLCLPDMHGSELLPQLRRISGCAHVPAVAVSADHDFDAMRCGFDEFWRKPMDLRRVIARVQALVAPAATRYALPPMPLLTTPALVAQLAARL